MNDKIRLVGRRGILGSSGKDRQKGKDSVRESSRGERWTGRKEMEMNKENADMR